MLKKWLGISEQTRFIVARVEPELPVVHTRGRSVILVDGGGQPIMSRDVAKQIAKDNSVDGQQFAVIPLKSHSDTKE